MIPRFVRCRAFACTALLAGWALAGAAQSLAQIQTPLQPAPATGSGRPKICLVLSGGGARGAAHIGVLQVLEDLRVPVDCVVGTSMGSIVGAAYASGLTVKEMDAILGRMSSRLLFKDQPPREERAVRLKRDDATNLAPVEIGLNSDGLLLPKGLVSGVQLEAVLRELSKARGFWQFDRLPLPFRAVATDLVTGKAVVLKEGELAAAMRASMSVPGVIEPVRLGGRLLVDGGLTNNLPVDVARSMGAEVIIAVNLGTPLLRANQLNSIVGVSAQMVNILTEQNVQASLASLGPRDILIVPHLDDFSAGDFDHLHVAVPVGAAAARAVADLLAAYSVPPETYARWSAHRVSIPTEGTVIADEIRFNEMKWVNPDMARAVLETRVGEPIDQKVLDRDMQRLFGTGDYEHVSYALLEEPGKTILSVDAVEKSWGPNYLRLGLGLSSDFSGDSFFNLLASYRKTWLNSLGAEWRVDGQVGRTSRFSTELYQPLQRGPGLFVAPRAEAERSTTDVFQGVQRIATYDTTTYTVGVDLGAALTHYGEVRLGVEASRFRANLDTGPTVFDTNRADLNSVGLRLRAVLDQLDNLNFPSKGYGAVLDVYSANKEMGSDTNFTRMSLSGSYVQSFGDHTFQLGAKFGRNLGGNPLPPSEQFQWGGFLQVSGLPTGALLGEELNFGRLVYTNRVARFSLLDGVYLGASLEVGRMSKSLLPGNDLGTLHAGSLMLGVDTPIGPLYLAYGRASKGYDSFYLFLGRP